MTSSAGLHEENLEKELNIRLKVQILVNAVVLSPVVDVLTVGSRVGEFSEAFFALIGLVPCMKSLVLDQMMLEFESFVTGIALVRSRLI